MSTSDPPLTETPASVLRFWFEECDRTDWFSIGKTPQQRKAFDEALRARFGPTVELALGGGLVDWEEAGGRGPAAERDVDDSSPLSPHAGRLALIVLLDQLPRNIFRGSARAFAGEARALALADSLVADGSVSARTGDDAELRRTMLLPFMHSERMEHQDLSVRLYAELATHPPSEREGAGFAHMAVRHRDVIREFGRFIQRDAALGRATSAVEAEALREGRATF